MIPAQTSAANEFLVLLAQKFAFRLKRLAFAENFQVALKAIVEDIPELLAFGGKFE